MNEPRVILHVDMDAFYAAIEQRDQPALRGKPVIVGSPPDRRGVVSTASYEARPYGVHSAMPSRTAGRLCPQATFVPVNMAHYSEVSHDIMEVLESFTPMVEKTSIDEAFLDMSGARHLWPDSVQLARILKQRIRERVHLTASVGVASNKFLAKLASDLEKPDGLTVVPVDPEEIVRFLAPLPVSKVWGVGKAAAKRLKSFGIQIIGDVQSYDQAHLQSWFGEAFGEHLWRLSRGLDDRPVVTEREAKSISNEHTFRTDCDDLDAVRQTLIELTENVGRRMRRAGVWGRTGQIKVRFDDFKTVTRQRPFSRPTQTDRELLHCALALLDAEQVQRPVRLIGFGVQSFTDKTTEAGTVQGELFPDPPGDDGAAHQAALDAAVDRVRESFGKDAIRRGGTPRSPGVTE